MQDAEELVFISSVQESASDTGALVSSCSGAATQKKETWGIYVYFAADVPNPEMQAAAWRTLKTIASVGSSSTVKITAMIDLPGKNTDYYIIPEKPDSAAKWTILPDRFLSNVNSASIDTIVDFFEWSNRNCPADNVALIVWGHGYALDDYDPNIEPIGASASQQPASGKGRIANAFPGERGNELKLLYDASYNSAMSNGDFAQAVRDYTERLNGSKPIKVLGLDCCNMAMAEIVSELQGLADYVVAAESGLPYQSWLTKPLLRKFLKNELIDARDFAVGAVEDFIRSMSRSADTYVALSACNLDHFRTVETAMKQFVDALLPAIDKYENRKAVAQAWEDGVSFVPDGLIDLASFCKLLEISIPKNASKDAYGNSILTCIENDVVQGAAEVQRAVANVIERKGIAPNLLAKRLALSTGLSIWFPPWIQFPRVRYFQMKQSKDYFFDGYSSTHFAKVTGWDRFLGKLFFLTQQ